MDNNTYISILTDTLVKKNTILDNLIEITLQQEKLIDETLPNMDNFEETILEKNNLITRLNQLDEGFEKIYEYVSDEIKNNKSYHKEEILYLQNLIKQVTEKSTKIQTLELKNRGKLEIYFSSRKKEIRNFNKNSQTVAKYYKSMANISQGESYFLDKKK